MPPYDCQKACDQNTLCSMFMTNTVQNKCWLSRWPQNTGVYNLTLLLKIRSSAESVASLRLTSPATQAKASNSASNYSELKSRWAGDMGTVDYTVYQPTDAGFSIVPLDQDNSADGYIHDDVMMQICDERDQCDVVCQYFNNTADTRKYGSWVEFFANRAHFTTFVHRHRCSSGVLGSTKTARTGGTYLYCPQTSDVFFPLGNISSTFPLPPGTCEAACDMNPACSMYTVDQRGLVCWLAGKKSKGPAGTSVLIKLRD